jgi:hypothetical protein
MQVRYCVWKKELKKIGIHNEKQLFHPETNIKAGKFVLAKHHVWAKGNLEQALNDYSNGKKWYVEKVLYEAMKAE